MVYPVQCPASVTPCSSGQQPQQPGAPPQQDYTKAWEEYYKKQGELLGWAKGETAWVVLLPATHYLYAHSTSGHWWGSWSTPWLPA